MVHSVYKNPELNPDSDHFNPKTLSDGAGRSNNSDTEFHTFFHCRKPGQVKSLQSAKRKTARSHKILRGLKVSAISQSKGQRVNFAKLQTWRRRGWRWRRRTTFTAKLWPAAGSVGGGSAQLCQVYDSRNHPEKSPKEGFKKTGTDGMARSGRSDEARVGNNRNKLHVEFKSFDKRWTMEDLYHPWILRISAFELF